MKTCLRSAKVEGILQLLFRLQSSVTLSKAVVLAAGSWMRTAALVWRRLDGDRCKLQASCQSCRIRTWRRGCSNLCFTQSFMWFGFMLNWRTTDLRNLCRSDFYESEQCLRPLGNGLLTNVLPGTVQLCIWSIKSDHSRLVEENTPSVPSKTFIWLVQIGIPKDFLKTPKHEI